MLNITLTSLTIFSSNYLITIVLSILIRTVKISIWANIVLLNGDDFIIWNIIEFSPLKWLFLVEMKNSKKWEKRVIFKNP